MYPLPWDDVIAVRVEGAGRYGGWTGAGIVSPRGGGEPSSQGTYDVRIAPPRDGRYVVRVLLLSGDVLRAAGGHGLAGVARAAPEDISVPFIEATLGTSAAPLAHSMEWAVLPRRFVGGGDV